jgi:hypothetical protein
MALGLTQPLTEMSTRNVSWGLRRPVRTAEYLATIWEPQLLWNRQGLSRPVMELLACYVLHESLML